MSNTPTTPAYVHPNPEALGYCMWAKDLYTKHRAENPDWSPAMTVAAVESEVAERWAEEHGQ